MTTAVLAAPGARAAAAPLRIAMMLESDGPGGAEVMVFQLAEELRARGHDVVPVGPAKGVGWLGAKFRDAGFRPEVFHLQRPIDPACARALEATFRRRGVNVVHSHEFTMAVYGTLAARRAGARHVITLHGSQTMNRALRRRIAIRWAIRNSAAAIAVSRATHGSLVHDLGIRPQALHVVPNGVPARPGDATRVRAQLGLRDNEVVLLAVGNLSTRKGHRVMLEALRRLDAAGLATPWRFIIAGGRGGEEQAPLEAFVAEHGMTGRVHILTHREDVPDLQAAADVFAMPSLWEGLPMALLEAMLAGKALVASRTSGIPEAVTNEVDGLLVPPGDVDALAAALRRLITEPALRARLGASALARGRRDFTVGVMADAYERHYRGD